MAIYEMASETNGLLWRSNAVRVLVLTTDAPFHTGRCATGCACYPLQFSIAGKHSMRALSNAALSRPHIESGNQTTCCIAKGCVTVASTHTAAVAARLAIAAGRTLQDDYKYYDYPTMSETLALLKARNIKFVGICQPGCDEYQMQYLVSALSCLHSE